MAQTTSLVFNGGVIPAPSGNGKAKLLKIGEITITEQEAQVTKKVICDPDSITMVAPFMEVLTSAKLAELVKANNVIVLDDGTMQYLMASANIVVEDETAVCTSVSFLGLSRENRSKVTYSCTRVTDELTIQQVIEVGEPVETDFNLVSADSEDTAPGTLIDKLEVVDNVRDPEDPADVPLLSLETTVDRQGNRKVAINEDNLRTFVGNVSSSFDAIGNLQTTVSNQGTAIGNLQNGKKDKQQPKTFNGSATKTVKKVTQNEDGEVTVEYENIDLPPEVPNVEITSPHGTINVQSSTDVQTNIKTFEIDVEANGGNSCGWFNSSNIDTVGNEESINVDRFRISEGQTVLGNGLEFVPIEGDTESGVQFGNVYANAGIYFVSARLNVSWTGNSVNKVCNVGGRQFDFSYNHEEKVITTNLMRFSSRTKMSVTISLESDIPAGLRIWVDRFQIFAINAGTLEIQGLEAVEHDGTLTGNGTNENPLSIQSALDVSNANTAPEYDPTATYPTAGTLCYHENVLYKSTVAINTAEAWNPAHWTTTSVDEQIGNVEALLAAL